VGGTGDTPWDAALRGPADLVRGRDATSFVARLDRWLADASVDDAALRRARERWLREVAEQESTLSGVLADLAERHVPVAVRTTMGRRHHGSIQVIGADFVGVRTATGTEVLVALEAIGSLRTAPAVEATLGDRMVVTELRLADVLSRLAEERERVLLVTRADDDVIAGALRGVGHDVVVVRVEGERPSTAYVPTAAIVEVSLG
jgi:hypothetical protein